MPNENVRLVVHAACLLTIFISVVVLVALGKLESAGALQWFTAGAGLITATLSTTKLIQDRRSGPTDNQ
ncbi:hypothetical protein [Mycobacteroides immunogenum]|uniref:Uncharacterized protein n=1 Tax=Mycobacteroides immunogenum TaxID=83262 RepID=A0A7V8RUN9_9MYCO|nr:hypothetical protein [Mycobacteroides immunogenum]AMT70519.1 membrane protein [Mycobacteroides immunogenum]ANO03597.1 hypothetical protein BAB75_09550 [Mycobacteroides immunogenum]KIU38526.1 membrane protein [Mycobacteroides immunogenum]KPG04264.1 hypothetical protein AN909_23625 [Mycobacteroides immunogenum]KPG04820.1 hypothetical protein AN908_23590 [Mycobacteroides immunogenum]